MQDLKHLLKDDANTDEGKTNLGKGWCSTKEPSTITTPQLVSFAVHSSHGSLSRCHEWMSPGCWTPGLAVNSVLATWPVLVAWNGCIDPEGSQHPAWRHSCQSLNVPNHCYCSFGVTAHWLYQYWDNYRVGSTPKHGKHFGLLQPLHQTHHGVCDPQSNYKDHCYISGARIYLNLWSISQAPEWLRSQLWKQHHQRALWPYGHLEG